MQLKVQGVVHTQFHRMKTLIQGPINVVVPSESKLTVATCN